MVSHAILVYNPSFVSIIHQLVMKCIKQLSYNELGPHPVWFLQQHFAVMDLLKTGSPPGNDKHGPVRLWVRYD